MRSFPDDKAYLAILLQAIGTCRSYRPKFGLGGTAGQTLESFRAAYQADPFYHWFGLDSPLVYAAHRAAGGITSVYRQIGIGCQWIFTRILQDSLGLTQKESQWAYTVPSGRKGVERTLSLDGRIPLTAIRNGERLPTVRQWLQEAAVAVKLDKSSSKKLRGAVFEVRQGYKSADSKRQNADISNAANAYARSYLPVVLLFSQQIPQSLAERYARAQWLILRGSVQGGTIASTYSFCRDILGYDLAAFFTRNSKRIRTEIESILQSLLQ